MEATTWAGLFAERARGDDPAIRTATESWTTGELAELVGGAHRWLETLDLPLGRPVPALLSSGPEALALVLAGTLTGRPLAPLSLRLTAREVGACVAPMASPLVVAEAEALPLAHAVAELTGRLAVPVPELSPAQLAAPADLPGDSPALVLHTSGTTGVPKAVTVTQSALAARARCQSRVIRLGPGDVYTTASPFHHIAGVGTVLVALGAGAGVVLGPPFTVDAWRSLERFRPTHAVLVSSMIEALLADEALNLPSLRVLMYGSAPMRGTTARAAIAALPGVDLMNIYGQTEGSPLTCLDGADHRRAATEGRDYLLATVGRPVEGVELRVVGPTPRSEGEMWARAPHLFGAGPDGWLRTGDVGSVDTDGYVRLVGRKGDLIIRGGENVYPLEVERVLAEHPLVREAAVVGVPDDRLGQAVRAVIVPADPAEAPDPTDLRTFARRQLAGFKVPASWRFVDDLPRNAVGKVVRAQLSGL